MRSMPLSQTYLGFSVGLTVAENLDNAASKARTLDLLLWTQWLLTIATAISPLTHVILAEIRV